MLLILNLVGCAGSDVAQPVFLAPNNKTPQIAKLQPQAEIKKNQAIKTSSKSVGTEKHASELQDEVQAVAQEVLLAVISTNYTDRTYDLLLSIDTDQSVLGIKTKSNKGKVKSYPLAVLDREVVLVKAIGVSLVTLMCTNFHQTNGCPIEIEYPSNLTYGKFSRFQAQLINHNGQWQLQSSGRAFTSMHLMAKKLLGLLIGVERIELR